MPTEYYYSYYNDDTESSDTTQENDDEAFLGLGLSNTGVIAAAAGGRAGTCMIAAPSLIAWVCGANQASTLTTSEP